MAVTVETKELEGIDLLKTHYFKTNYDNLKEICVKILEEKGFHIVSIDDNYFEIFAERPRMSVTVKIIEQNPKETSIDFYVNSESLFGNRKKCMNFIADVLGKIEKKYELKGLSLHP